MRNDAFFRGSLLVLAAAGAGFFLLPAGGRAATWIVNIGANGGTVFQDQASGTSTTTIQAGDTVQWNWVSGTHSTTSGACTSGGYYGGSCTPDGGWDAGQHSQGYSFTKTFPSVGSFNYYCSIHQGMMTGLVKVLPATNPAPSADFKTSPTGPVVGTEIHFIDTSAGSPTSWSWDFGDGQSSNVQDPTHAYAAAGAYTVKLSATGAGGTNVSTKSVTVAAGGQVTCVLDGFTLCLSNGRFQVTAQWQKPDNTSGPGNAISLTADSGYFWFFDSTNIELVTKVLNACGVNGNYWVFSAGLTNVKVTLSVLDTQTGVEQQYINAQGNAYQPIQDTSAFSTCP